MYGDKGRIGLIRPGITPSPEMDFHRHLPDGMALATAALWLPLSSFILDLDLASLRISPSRFSSSSFEVVRISPMISKAKSSFS